MSEAAPRLAPASVPRLARGVRLREDKARDRWVVLAPERAFVPDDQALAVLLLLDGARSVNDAVGALAERYAAPRETIAGDVLELLQDLADRGVVVFA